MKRAGSVVASALGGAGFGAATSLVNDVSSPYGMFGTRIAGTGWAWAAEVVSRLIGLGWAWAGLAMAAGWLAGTSTRGAMSGVLALLTATTAYYGSDSVLRDESFAGYWSEIQLWWFASTIFGSALGVVGANIKRPGVIGLLAGLTLPVGATTETILRSSISISTTSAMNCARVIVWAAAAVAAGVVITRFLTTRQQVRRGNGTGLTGKRSLPR